MPHSASRVIDETFARILHSIRAGDFLAVLEDHGALGILEEIAAQENIESVTCLQASIMLAETCDQTSQYLRAERYLSFDPRAAKALRRLKQLTEVKLNVSVGEDIKQSGTTRRLFRALAFFCLQHAIALHRDTEDASSALNGAILLAKEAEKCLKQLNTVGYNFDGTRSMFQYWIGRFQLMNRNWKDARICFQTSMRHEHDNLRFHLERHAESFHGEPARSPDECPTCSAKILYTNYLLASNMAFGLAMVEMEEGTVENALTLLRPAMIMLDGSTQDDYRRGYVRLLIGRAERVRAGARVAELSRAIQSLQQAKALFTQNSNRNASHHFYAARALHQLCIAFMFMARDSHLSLPQKEDALLDAVRHFVQAIEQYGQESTDKTSEKYIDHRLEVRLALTKTRLLGQVLKACATWPGGTVRDKLQSWAHRLPVLSGLSSTWHAQAGRVTPDADDGALLGQLASELLDSMSVASVLDGRLFGDDTGRSYVQLAEAEAVAMVVQYGGDNIDAKRGERFLWRLSAATSTISHQRLHPRQGKWVPETWKDSALAAVIPRMKELAVARRTIKVRAAAEVTLAHLLFLRGGNGAADARKQLREGWEPIRKQVENHILEDSVSEMLQTFEPTESICLIPLEDSNGPQTWAQIQATLKREVLGAFRRQGMNDAAISVRLKKGVSTIQSWRE